MNSGQDMDSVRNAAKMSFIAENEFKRLNGIIDGLRLAVNKAAEMADGWAISASTDGEKEFYQRKAKEFRDAIEVSKIDNTMGVR